MIEINERNRDKVIPYFGQEILLMAAEEAARNANSGSSQAGPVSFPLPITKIRLAQWLEPLLTLPPCSAL